MTLDLAEFDRRLAAHMDAARKHGGPAVTKSTDFYGGELEAADVRQRVIETCQAAGIRGEFTTPMFSSRKSLRLWSA